MWCKRPPNCALPATGRKRVGIAKALRNFDCSTQTDSPLCSTRLTPDFSTMAMTTKIQYTNPPGAGPAQGLYTNVTLMPAGPVAHIAGQLSVDKDGSVVGKHDFEAQMLQVFSNLGNVL